MDEYNKFLLKIGVHTTIIIIIVVVSYQTYILLKSLPLSPAYILLGIIALTGCLYYAYKICEQIFEYRRQHEWHPNDKLVKQFYETIRPGGTITPKKIKVAPDVEPITELISVDIDLDLDKGLFYSRDLDVEEKYYLINHKYQKGNFVPIGKIRQEECYVKANNIESLQHTFLVENIRQEIQKYTKDVKISLSKEPDIIFKNAKKETVALEIETGTGYKKHKIEFELKFHETKERYKKNLYIVLTDSRHKQQYKNLFKKIRIFLRQDILAFLESQFPPQGREYIPAKTKRDTGHKKATLA